MTISQEFGDAIDEDNGVYLNVNETNSQPVKLIPSHILNYSTLKKYIYLDYYDGFIL